MLWGPTVTSLTGVLMSEVFHGGGLDAAIAKYGGERRDWLDLSTGINPNAYPVADLPDDVWQQLPDKGAEKALIDAAREYYQVLQDRAIVAAPGTQALIEMLPDIIKADSVSILSPTYGEHANAWEKKGVAVSLIDHPEAVKSKDVLVIVNPNNPTGQVHGDEALVALASKVKLLIVDEAFCDTCPEESIVPVMPDNVIVLKSFGKFFGLAGLRLGFAICSDELAKDMQSRLGPWAVSGPALAIGARAFQDKHWIDQTCSLLIEQSRQLAAMLSGYGFHIEGSTPLFVYAKHENAGDVFDHMAKHHILVRPFPERPNYLRFGLCKNDETLKRLETALKSYG